MSGNEFFWCSITFIITTTVTFIVMRAAKIRNPYSFLVLAPGFIVANLISYIMSELVEVGLTDQPILYGFPITFFQLTVWEGFKVQWLQFLLIVAVLLILSWAIGKAIQLQQDSKYSLILANSETVLLNRLVSSLSQLLR